MIRRHPHVFGDQAVAGVAEVWRNWEQLKALEPAGRQAPTAASTASRKALAPCSAGRRCRTRRRVSASIGRLPTACARSSPKNSTELEAARRDDDARAIREELGDVFFTLVNYARTLGIDAEGAMRDADAKFERRFRYMESPRGNARAQPRRPEPRRTRRTVAARKDAGRVNEAQRRGSDGSACA